MEYANHLNEYAPAWSEAQVAEEVARIREAAKRNHNAEVYKMCYSAIDITTLSCNDSVTSVTEFARKTAEFYQKFPHIPNVASICIYPAFVETVGLAVDGTPMKITSVGGGFPAAQTFLEVKALEVAMAVENGADEIDMVIHIGALKEGNLSYVIHEIAALKKAAGSHILKVIVETCYLTEEEKIAACRAVTEGGADYIKTSTGFGSAGAALEDVKLFKKYVGENVKIKAAGGIHSRKEMEDFLHAGASRIGASGAIPALLGKK